MLENIVEQTNQKGLRKKNTSIFNTKVLEDIDYQSQKMSVKFQLTEQLFRLESFNILRQKFTRHFAEKQYFELLHTIVRTCNGKIEQLEQMYSGANTIDNRKKILVQVMRDNAKEINSIVTQFLGVRDKSMHLS